MANGINLIKKFKALISVRVPLETVPTDGKLRLDSLRFYKVCFYYYAKLRAIEVY